MGTGEPVKRPLERDLERKISLYAEKKGCLGLKLNVTGQRGWPDRLFMYEGNVLFVEFKRPGEKPTLHQVWMHERIRAYGGTVVIIDDPVQGMKVIDELVAP
jgi:hypothetical protein